MHKKIDSSIFFSLLSFTGIGLFLAGIAAGEGGPPAGPTIAKDSIQAMAYTFNVDKKNFDTWSWAPQLEFRVNGPIASGSQLYVEFNVPGTGAVKFDCKTGEIPKGHRWKTECGGRDVPEEKGSTYTGPVEFTIHVRNELNSTDAKLFTGSMKVTKVHSNEHGPKFANHFVYYVDQDWNLPIGYVFLTGDPVTKMQRPRLSSAFWYRGDGGFEPHLFYRGKEADTELTLDSSDHIELGVLAVDQYVDGHWCKQGTRVKRGGTRAIWFTLARDEKVGGIECKAGAEVVVAEDGGHVMSAVLARDQQIGGTPCRGGDPVDFDYGGSFPLYSCVICRVATLLGEEWPAGTKLKGLSPNHSLEVTLPRGASKMFGDTRLGDIKFVGRCRIGFEGTPPRVRVAEVLAGEPGYVELLGAHYSEILMFDDQGRGTLSETATIHGEACKAGDTIDFKFGKPK